MSLASEMRNISDSAFDVLCDNLDKMLDNCNPNPDYDCDDEWLIWLRIPDEFNDYARVVTKESLEDYWYELICHPDDDSVFVNIVGDSNMIDLNISMMMANKVRRLFKA